jgi:hypothetical protein
MTNYFDTSSRFWRAAGITTGIGMLISVCILAILWYQYAYTRPRSPQPLQGRVYGLNTHGVVVYLTKGEQYNLYLAGGIALIFGLCFAFIIMYVFKGKRS